MQPDRWDQTVPHRGGGAPGRPPAPGARSGSPRPDGRRGGPTRAGWDTAAHGAPISEDDVPTGPVAVIGGPVDDEHSLPGAGPAEHGPTERVDDGPVAPRGRGRRGGGGGRRLLVPLLAVLLLVGGVVAGGLYLFTSMFSTPDFEGAGAGDVIIEVSAGDSTTRIGNELQAKGVVASVQAFTDAAREEDRIRSVQPGFYQLRLEMSGAAAVARLLDPAARVGQLEIRGGVQLDDTSAPDGTVAPGVLSLIAQASCTGSEGQQRCLTTDELRAAMVETDPAALGVPEWALEDVARADPVRRLEGLLVPGRYDVLPNTPAAEVLRRLLAASASKLEAAGLVSGAQAIGSTPYQVLVIASLVEKEAITADMPKVARVVYNRLGAGQRLELDSMVNYPLDLQALRTTAEDRARPGPYNSYVVTGLPPTPIAAAGTAAIAAALAPEPGPWFFFVRCETDGRSCFAVDFAEHNQNVALARQNGAF